jgi:hypothetical protein
VFVVDSQLYLIAITCSMANQPTVDHSPVSKSNSMTGTPSLDGTANGTPLSVEDLRDAGSGKVRGPNGRYVNKDNPSPPAKKKSNIKYVKKCKSATRFSTAAPCLAEQYANIA